MKTNLALIGFMGVGKSAVGDGLAERLGKKLVRTDAMIELQAGKSVSRIFQEDGEIVFREMEIEAVKKAASERNQVIDCGGGVVLNRINIDRLKLSSIVVWLTASNEIILKRTAADNTGRPLLEGKQTSIEIGKMLSYRQPLYTAAADITIDTSNLNVLAVEEKITGKLRNHANFS
ncbi:MAG: shikimate kinase [Dehalococcoidales bacterium]|nr:shikimate kinase [Dehalococcoidales bacterium]